MHSQIRLSTLKIPVHLHYASFSHVCPYEKTDETVRNTPVTLSASLKIKHMFHEVHLKWKLSPKGKTFIAIFFLKRKSAMQDLENPRTLDPLWSINSRLRISCLQFVKIIVGAVHPYVYESPCLCQEFLKFSTLLTTMGLLQKLFVWFLLLLLTGLRLWIVFFFETAGNLVVA